MKSLSRLTIILFGIALFLYLTTGCSVTYRAKIYSIPPDLEVNEFQGEGEAVSIKNQAREGVVPIGRTLPIGSEAYVLGEPDIKRYLTDLKQVTDVIASILAEELSKKGFSIRRDASKSITLNVTGIYLFYIYPSYQCVIEMEYTTSDGHNQTIRGDQSSDHYDSACNGAIMTVVVDLLNDGKLRDFLRKRMQ